MKKETAALGLTYALLLCLLAPTAALSAFVSTGANGPLVVVDNTSLDSGRYDFTDVSIATNATLFFNPSPDALDIYLLAQGNVTIDGGLYAPGANLHISTPATITIKGSVQSGNVYLSAGSFYFPAPGGIQASGNATTGTGGPAPGTCGAAGAIISTGGVGISVPPGSCGIIIPGGSTAGSGGTVSISIAPIPLPGSAVLLLTAVPLLALFCRRRAIARDMDGFPPIAPYQSA